MVIENFDVVCSIGDRVVLTMQTVFGFFPPEAFANQVGLTADGNHRALLELRAGPMIDLTARSADCFDGELRLGRAAAADGGSGHRSCPALAQRVSAS